MPSWLTFAVYLYGFSGTRWQVLRLNDLLPSVIGSVALLTVRHVSLAGGRAEPRKTHRRSETWSGPSMHGLRKTTRQRSAKVDPSVESLLENIVLGGKDLTKFR